MTVNTLFARQYSKKEGKTFSKTSSKSIESTLVSSEVRGQNFQILPNLFNSQHQLYIIRTKSVAFGMAECFFHHEVIFLPSISIISAQLYKNSRLSPSCCWHTTTVWQASFLSDWFSLTSNWNLQVKFPAAHCGDKCCELNNAIDYRICMDSGENVWK